MGPTISDRGWPCAGSRPSMLLPRPELHAFARGMERNALELCPRVHQRRLHDFQSVEQDDIYHMEFFEGGGITDGEDAGVKEPLNDG